MTDANGSQTPCQTRDSTRTEGHTFLATRLLKNSSCSETGSTRGASVVMLAFSACPAIAMRSFDRYTPAPSHSPVRPWDSCERVFLPWRLHGNLAWGRDTGVQRFLVQQLGKRHPACLVSGLQAAKLNDTCGSVIVFLLVHTAVGCIAGAHVRPHHMRQLIPACRQQPLST